MTTDQVFQWIKTLTTKPEHYYCGMLDSKQNKSFGVYQLKDQRARDIAIGGMSTTKTAVKGISILIHWTSSTKDTETIAASLYAELAAVNNPVIGDKKANYIQLLHNEPIDVGADENGVCERVIEFIIHYERS